MCDPAHPFHLATFSTQQTTNHLIGHERPHARSDEVVHPAQHVGVRLPLSKGDLPARIRDSMRVIRQRNQHRDASQGRLMGRCPSVPVGSAIIPKTSIASWALLFPLPVLSGKRTVRHKLCYVLV
jgi:hypothetical protein